MIDKGKLFRKAWRIAKRAAEETGEKASKFFREALKIAWKQALMVGKRGFTGYAELKEDGENRATTYKLWEKNGQKRIYMSYRKCNAYIILAGTERGHVETLKNGYRVATDSKYKADHELMVTLANDFFKNFYFA